MISQTKSIVSKSVKQGIITFLLGGGFTVAFFYLAACVIVQRTISQSMFSAFATAAFCLGCCVSSFILATQRKSGGLLCAAICFCAYSTILLIWSYVCNTQILSLALMIRLLLLAFSACLGGCFGVSKAEKRLRRKRKAS